MHRAWYNERNPKSRFKGITQQQFQNTGRDVTYSRSNFLIHHLHCRCQTRRYDLLIPSRQEYFPWLSWPFLKLILLNQLSIDYFTHMRWLPEINVSILDSVLSNNQLYSKAMLTSKLWPFLRILTTALMKSTGLHTNVQSWTGLSDLVLNRSKHNKLAAQIFRTKPPPKVFMGCSAVFLLWGVMNPSHSTSTPSFWRW